MKFQLAGVMLLAGVMATGCGDAGTESRGEPVGAVQSEILNGWDMNDAAVKTWALAAVYHPPKTGTATWSGRPCGGVILRSENGVSAVLTARHCVTMDASAGGTVAPVNRIRLAASANPGPADPNPPTWAVQPTSIVAMPVNPGFPSTDWDLAVVFANVDWSDRGIYRFGLWVGEPSTLTGLPFMARGYGINVDDQECDTNGTTMGAGQARQGFDFVVQFAARAGLAGAYSYNNWSTNNQAVMCGDSGGPDHANIGPEDFVWTHLIGIHSTGKLLNTPVQSSVTGRWVQDTIGGTYLSSDANRDLNIARLDSPFFGPMWQMVNKVDPRAVRMFYDPATQAIQGAGRCMQQSGANVLARSCTPSTSTQRWTITQNRWFKNVASNQCLTLNGTGLSVQDCSFSSIDFALRQHWTFHAQR